MIALILFSLYNKYVYNLSKEEITIRIDKLNKNRERQKKVLLSCTVFLLLFSIGSVYAYSNKPKNIKYGNINIQATEQTISTLEKIANNITSTKPGIKISIHNNENNDEMFQQMLEGSVDIILPSREMNDSEEKLAEEYNISYKKLPFATLKGNENKIIYMYISDMNYNHKPENKVFAKNYYGPDRTLVEKKDLNPLTEEEYNKVIDYLKLIDEF